MPRRRVVPSSGSERSGGVWRPARPDAAWRQFVLIGRFPAVLMPTSDAPRGPILTRCAARRRNEQRPSRGLDRARARSGARSRPRGGRCWSGRRAARQERIGPCGVSSVGIRTAGNRPERTNSHRAASGRRRHLRAPETRSEPEDGTTRLRGMAPVRPRRTSPGSPDAYRRCSARPYPRLVRGVPSKRTAAAARPRPCEGSIGRRDLRRDFDKTKPSASIHAPPTPHTTHLTQPPDSTRSGSG